MPLRKPPVPGLPGLRGLRGRSRAGRGAEKSGRPRCEEFETPIILWNMLYDTLHTFVFSPTGTGRRTADAIARGFGAANRCDCDLAHCEASPVTLPRESAALFVVPVYGGRVAPASLRRLGQLRGDRTPPCWSSALRQPLRGRALRELEAAVCGRGFVPVAAAACVGEHSYSSHRWPDRRGASRCR